MAIVVALALMSLFGLTPYAPSHQDVAQSLHAPSGAHWFGTDQFGRDIFSRVASGVANSLRIAIVSVAAAAVAGTLLGVLAGYYQGIVDRIVGVITNVLFAFPSLLLALALAATLARSWLTVSLSIAIVYMPIFARVARAPGAHPALGRLRAGLHRDRADAGCRPCSSTSCPTSGASWSSRSPCPCPGRSSPRPR